MKQYRADRARIVDVYRKWKMRKFLSNILKLWRHQAVQSLEILCTDVAGRNTLSASWALHM